MPLHYEPIDRGLHMEKRLVGRMSRKKAQLDEYRPLRQGIWVPCDNVFGFQTHSHRSLMIAQ